MSREHARVNGRRRLVYVQLAVNRQPGYRQRNSKCKHCRQNKAKILEISRNHESTNHHQLARWSTAEPSEASRAHPKTMGQCLVQFYEHYFFIRIGARKKDAPSGPCSALSACMKISSGQKLDHMYIRCSAKRERDPSTQLGAYGVQRSKITDFYRPSFGQICPAPVVLATGGKPSTWLPPGTS